MASEAEVPPGVFNMVMGDGPNCGEVGCLCKVSVSLHFWNTFWHESLLCRCYCCHLPRRTSTVWHHFAAEKSGDCCTWRCGFSAFLKIPILNGMYPSDSSRDLFRFLVGGHLQSPYKRVTYITIPKRSPGIHCQVSIASDQKETPETEVSFTGSTRAGRRISEVAAKTLKIVSWSTVAGGCFKGSRQTQPNRTPLISRGDSVVVSCKSHFEGEDLCFFLNEFASVLSISYRFWGCFWEVPHFSDVGRYARS